MKLEVTFTNASAASFVATNWNIDNDFIVVDMVNWDDIVVARREQVAKLNGNGSWVSTIARKEAKEVEFVLHVQNIDSTIETNRQTLNTVLNSSAITISVNKIIDGVDHITTATAYLNDDILWAYNNNTATANIKLIIPVPA